MIDVLFVFPLFYNIANLKNFMRDIDNEIHNFRIEVLVLNSNPKILIESIDFQTKTEVQVFDRTNHGGGEGSFHFIQSNLKLNYKNYRYLWYMEESCIPIKKGWVNQIINQLDDGIPLNGWDWHSTGKFRSFSQPVKIKRKNSGMTAFLNIGNNHFDSHNRSFNYIWDTPAYRHETIVFPMDTFSRFHYPDPRDNYFSSTGNERYYGIRAERLWWSDANYLEHQIPIKSPNLQWQIMLNNLYVPNRKNINFNFFRELSDSEKRNGFRI